MSASTASRAGSVSLMALWFGAAVSLAEIETGALFAPAGLSTGLLASLVGHLFGAVIFCAVAWLSAKRKKTAIAVSGRAFGIGGIRFFGLLNVIQLVGWTAVMVVIGAGAVSASLAPFPSLSSPLLWRLVLGGAILLWALLGPSSLGRLNVVASISLLFLCLLVSVRTLLPFLTGTAQASPIPPLGGTGFGSLVELAALMPLSWLPVVGDYEAASERPFRSALLSTAAYTAGSLWMYAIGLSSAIGGGTASIPAILGPALAVPAILVILLSTATTAWLDVKSAGISLSTVFPRAGTRLPILACGALGLLLSLAAPVERFTDFLGLVGTCFAPLYAVVLCEVLCSRCFKSRGSLFPLLAAVFSWLSGVVLYRALAQSPTPLGTTVPVMAIVALLYALIRFGGYIWNRD